MRVMALDIGEARVGIAVSDEAQKIALPLKVLPFADVYNNSPSFRYLIHDYEPCCLVCGLPKTQAGELGPWAQTIQKQAREIASRAGLDLYFVDERLSSAEAKRILHEQGYNEKQMRGHIDMVAASLFLQAWLDSKEV